MWGALRRDPVRRNDRLGAAFVPRLETRHFTVHCSLGRPRAGRGHVVTSQGGMSISEICRTPSFTLWGVFNVLFRTHSPVIYLCSFRNGKKEYFLQFWFNLFAALVLFSSVVCYPFTEMKKKMHQERELTEYVMVNNK